jgi:thymidine kinase
MFSGKTEELIRRLKRAQYARQRVEIFKPAVDNRYDQDNVVSHDDNSVQSTPVSEPREILSLANNIEVAGIDEAQFFDDQLVVVCNHLANRGTRVIVAGLDMDYLGKPFGPIPGLMATAEHVTKVHAICLKCGDLANHSNRLNAKDSLIQLGEKEAYEPLCRGCFSALFPSVIDADSIDREEGSLPNNNQLQ